MSPPNFYLFVSEPWDAVSIMPIKVACQCGQAFAIKDEMAGKTLKCPKCQQPLKVPARPAAASAARPAAAPVPAPASSLAGLFEEAGFKEHKGPRCPQCAYPLNQPDAVLCTNCGFHLQSGQKVEGAKVYKQGERGHTEAADALLSRAATQIEVDKGEEKKNRGAGLPAWVLFLALAGLVGFVATMFLIPRDRAFMITGYCMAGFGGLMSFYFGVRMIMVAFQESTTCGVLYILFWPYQLYYLITRWERMGGLFLMNLAYNFLILVGMGMVAISPMLAKKENDAAFRPSGGESGFVAVRELTLAGSPKAKARRSEQTIRWA
jgi:hypothetical protein